MSEMASEKVNNTTPAPWYQPFLDRYGDECLAETLGALRIFRANNNSQLKARLGYSNQQHAKLADFEEGRILQDKMRLRMMEEVLDNPPLYGKDCRRRYEDICRELGL